MYTQEIVCPNCGKMTIVNVIDKSGSVKTPCQNCKYGIIVSTDKMGKVEQVRTANCFIATAAYGSYLDPHVQVLKNFRDNYLTTNFIGRACVNFYYSTSPFIADLILQYESLRRPTRWLLTPIVYGIKFLGKRRKETL